MEGTYCFKTNFILELPDKWQVLLMDQNFLPQSSLPYSIMLEDLIFWGKAKI